MGDFTLKNIVTGKGRALSFVEGQVLAGTTFCAVSQVLEPNETPYLPADGDPVRAFVVPDFKANNVFRSSVKLSRPVVVLDAPKK